MKDSSCNWCDRKGTHYITWQGPYYGKACIAHARAYRKDTGRAFRKV